MWRIVRLVLFAVLGMVWAVVVAVDGVDLGLDFQGGVRLVYEVEVPPGADAAATVARSRDVLLRRLDALGVDATGTARGRSIILEMAGGDERIHSIRADLTRPRVLELLEVDDEHQLPEPPEGIEVANETVGRSSTRYFIASGPGARERLEAAIATIEVPEGRRILLGRHDAYDEDYEEDYEAGVREADFRTYVVVEDGGVRGHVVDAELVFSEHSGGPQVSVEYDDEGRALFAALTRRLVDRRLAIVLDGEVLAAPVVMEEIGGGRAFIAMGGARSFEETVNEATSLVAALRSGALPAPIVPVDETIVGSTFTPAQQLYGVLGALGVWLAIVVAIAIRLRLAGAIWALLSVPFAVLGALALLGVLDGVLTVAFAAGVGLACVALLAAGAVHIELARRDRARASWIAIAIVHALLLLLGLALYSSGGGPVRGFAFGVLFAIPAALLACSLCASALGRRPR